jgi:hypothetical protein
MNIDFTNDIIKMKEREVLHKPFPTPQGYALFEKTKEGKLVRVIFPNEKEIKAYLNDLGYDWGNEGKDEFTNFDCEKRLFTVFPELKDAEVVAADPQWDPDKVPKDYEIITKHESTRTMEDIPHCAVKLREVDHQVTPASIAKKPDFLKKKKEDKKGDKKEDKKGDKNGDSEKDKNGKKLPPWLNKKKSKSKDYSELWEKVSGEYGGSLKVGDRVKNVNKKCTHYGSEGIVKKFNDIPGDKGVTIAYKCTNAGKTWEEGDLLDKTPDQLEKKD